MCGRLATKYIPPLYILIMYYNYRTIDGYQSFINIILSRRGLGKTFGAVMKGIDAFLFKNKRFIYVVENLEMQKKLCQNSGEKFFAAILKYLKNSKIKKDKIRYEKMFSAEVSEDKVLNKIQGGTILINGDTSGYIVALSDFSNLKRNNFVDVEYIIIDEFIPERYTVENKNTCYKVVSLVQSIARTENIKIFMLGNTVRKSDIILERLGIQNLKVGEIRRIKDEFGTLIVAERVDSKKYKQFSNKADSSVAGRLAKILKEDNLEQNEFSDEIEDDLLIPEFKRKQSKFMFTLVGEYSLRIHLTVDRKELYIFDDYGANMTNRFCINEKYMSGNVYFVKHYKQYLLDKLTMNHIKFESSTVYEKFKIILGLY